MTRRLRAIVAAASFAVVAGVLGWRWLEVSTAGDAAPADRVAALAPAPVHAATPLELEVTVLEIRPLPAQAPAASPAVTPPPAPTPAQPAPANRTLLRTHRPPRASARPELRAEPAEPRPADAPAKPEPRPALESNPYLYK